MLWRSSFNSGIARIADFCTAFCAYALSYVIWRVLHRAYQNVLPMQVELRLHLFLLAGVFSLAYVVLFELQKAYRGAAVSRGHGAREGGRAGIESGCCSCERGRERNNSSIL